MSYEHAIQTSLEALREFKWDVNDFLPETPGGTDCWMPWTLEDAHYIGKCVDHVVNAVLSTEMANHVTFEFTEAAADYHKAIKEQSVVKCQKVLNEVIKVVNSTGIALCRAQKEMKKYHVM